MRLSISEILKKADVLPVEDCIKFLQANNSAPLQEILKNAFDATVEFILPEGAPPYKENPYPGQETRLYSETRRLYIFKKGQAPNLKAIKREQLFIEILESIHPDDAKLLIAMKDKKLSLRLIDAEVVNRAFPGLIVTPFCTPEDIQIEVEPDNIQNDVTPEEIVSQPEDEKLNEQKEKPTRRPPRSTKAKTPKVEQPVKKD